MLQLGNRMGNGECGGHFYTRMSALRAVYAGESYLKSDITGGASDVGGLAPAGKPTPRELE
ncbi:MAG TPA: hypothetical protein VF221_21265, partial [Chloroflexota bacterium]